MSNNCPVGKIFWISEVTLLKSKEVIPSVFVLDAKGTIVAKDLRGAELKAKIAALLAAK